MKLGTDVRAVLAQVRARGPGWLAAPPLALWLAVLACYAVLTLARWTAGQIALIMLVAAATFAGGLLGLRGSPGQEEGR